MITPQQFREKLLLPLRYSQGTIEANSGFSTMNKMLVREDIGDGITLLTLNRAPVNALNPELLAEIEAQLIDIDGDKSIRALIITSGLSVFSAGMDLKEAQQFSIDEQTAIVDALNSSFMQRMGDHV